MIKSTGYQAGNSQGKQVASSKNYSFDSLMSQVTVHWTDRIVGFDVGYKSGQALKSRGNTDGCWYENFELRQGDYIVEIYGRHSNDTIYCIGFKTRSGYTKTWGNPCQGEAFSISNPGYFITSFELENLNHLNYIKPYWKEEYLYNVTKIDMPVGELSSPMNGNSLPDSVAFDDFSFMQGRCNYHFTGLTVLHTPEDIVGLQASYFMDGGNTSPGFHTGPPTSNCRTDKVSFAEGEFVNKVIVYVDQTVKGLVIFTTNNNKYVFGKTWGTQFANLYEVPEGFFVNSFSGGCGQTLHYLHIHLDEEL